MSPHDKQIFEQLELILSDFVPDAYACRLKLSYVTRSLQKIMSCPWNIAEQLIAYVRWRRWVSFECRLTIEEEIELLENADIEKSKLLLDQLSILKAASGAPPGVSIDVSVDIPRLRNYVDYDAVEDRSIYIKGDKASVISNISYTRPKGEFYGIDTMKAIDKWLDSGFRLKGGGNGLGFLFLYELFTKSFDARILRNDSTVILATLFMRFLPNDEITSQSTYMSILRILSLNPKKLLEKEGVLPKYEDTRTIKLSLMFRSSSILSKLMKEVTNQLFKLREELKLKVEFPRRYAPSPSLKVGSIKSFMKNDFAWVANDINNQSSSSRTFEFPVDIGNNTLIDKENIIALAKKPLQVIAFDKYIQFHSYAGSNDTLSKLPFKIDDHPYARSHIARQMINRLDEDVVVHSDNMKNAKFSAIRGLSKSEIKGTLDDAAKRKEVVALVQSLMKSLRKQKDIDESNIAKCLTSALGSLNNVVNCQMNNHVSERQKRSYQLGQHSGLFAKGTLDVLVQCLLSSDGEENIKLINPLLSDAEVKNIKCNRWNPDFRLPYCSNISLYAKSP